MNTALWVAAGLLALVFLAAGAAKTFQPKEKLAASGLTWVEDFSPAMVKFIGVAELAAGVGLILPAVLGIAEVLVPLAALGLVLMMVGAMVVHARRREFPTLPVNVVLLLLAAFVVWGRLGPHAF